jgi:hypothetical protein
MEEMTPPPTEDTTPPTPVGPSISGVSVTNITDTSAEIDVNSDEMVQGYVEYGTTEQYGASTPLSSEFTTSPSFVLENLIPETLYHYRVVVVDSAGTAAITGDETFTTLATPEPPPAEETSTSTTAASSTPTESESTGEATTSEATAASSTSETTSATTTESTETASSTPAEPALVVSNTETTYISTSTANIAWQINKDADSQIEYGTSTSYGSFTLIGAMAASHSVSLSSLTPDTKYYYRAISKTSAGEIAYSPAETFTTLAPAAPSYPIISNVTIDPIATSTATISWTTSRPATSDIQYGTTTSYVSSAGENQTLSTSHSRTIIGLAPSVLYHFRIVAADSEGNTALGNDRTFTTLVFASSTSASSSEATSAETAATGTNEETLISIAEQGAQAAAAFPGGGGGGLPVSPKHPLLLTVTALDGQVSFDWRKDSGIQNGTINTIIVRKEGASSVKSRIDGQIIYDGPSTTFTDTNVQNGVEYHYALYSYGVYGRFTSAARFNVTPQASEEQADIPAAEIATNTAPVLTRDLYQGLAGDDVTTLQAHLADNGYYPEALVTGYFGPLTESAVIRYQTLNSIYPTAGYVGPITRGVLGQ